MTSLAQRISSTRLNAAPTTHPTHPPFGGGEDEGNLCSTLPTRREGHVGSRELLRDLGLHAGTQQARSWQEKAGLTRRQQLDLNHSKVVITCNTWPWYGNEKRRRWGWNKKWTTFLSKLEDEVYRKWLVVSRMKPERNYRQLISGFIKAAMGTVNGSSCLRHCMIRLSPHLLTFLSLSGKIRDYLACCNGLNVSLAKLVKYWSRVFFFWWATLYPLWLLPDG